jgi:hypothetical protein
MARAYQLVIEFEGDDLANFDRVIALEETLSEALPRDLVDGHDVGQGIVNIFIHSDEPQRCFEEAMRVIDGAEPSPSAAAYRRRDEEDYVRVWPKDVSTPFTLR